MRPGARFVAVTEFSTTGMVVRAGAPAGTSIHDLVSHQNGPAG
jgi:hypothetical protein